MMDPSMKDRLEDLLSRCAELGDELSDASARFAEADCPANPDDRDRAADALDEAADCLLDAAECLKEALSVIK